MQHTNPLIGRLHYELLRRLVDECKVPSHDALRSLLHCSSSELEVAFDQLAEVHGVVLHPGRREVWAIHPFSVAPTPFLVESGSKRWWGNCAWCSLGIAALIDTPCVITTTLGAETEQVRLRVENGRLDREDFVVHFPIPMTRAWDNVVYTCSTMLLFRDPDHVADWSERHAMPLGDVQPVGKVFELAKRWYGGHLSATWTKIRVPEAREIFADLGLVHPVWQLPPDDEQF